MDDEPAVDAGSFQDPLRALRFGARVRLAAKGGLRDGGRYRRHNERTAQPYRNRSSVHGVFYSPFVGRPAMHSTEPSVRAR